MLSKFYNEAILELALKPRTPLLIKAGDEGGAAIDPTLPDMNFVRTRRNGQDEVYIPGSSLRGVIRSYAEKLVRSLNPDGACDPTQTREAREGVKKACFAGQDTTALDGPQAYARSCYACRLFGNTALAGRVRVGDFHLEGEPLLERRYGVAIDRVTGAVAQGPFEMEILTEGTFSGVIAIRNFTLGQLGLLAAALLDIGDGLVPIGFGKSKGLGRVELVFRRFTVRTLKDPQGELRGVGFWASEEDRSDYELPPSERERMPWGISANKLRGFYEATLEDDAHIRELLEEVAERWPEEVGG